MKRTLCLDFDGVIHSYTSGWKGARVISDPPVPGALEFIVRARRVFDVAICSARSHQWGGRRAMRRWLVEQYVEACSSYDETPEWAAQEICRRAFADPWDFEVRGWAKSVVRSIAFPRHKPAAHLYIDDRAWRFEGAWPRLEEVSLLKPWNKIETRRTNVDIDLLEALVVEMDSKPIPEDRRRLPRS